MMKLECNVRYLTKLAQRSGLRIALLLAMATALHACSGGPPPRMYLLNTPTQPGKSESVDVSSLKTLGISQVKVPGYATDTRIASLGTNGVVGQMDAQRWAEDPEAAITRYLADGLRQQAEATVLVEPWPRDYSPQARVEVIFDRLLREPDGGVSTAGQILLLSGNGRSLLQSVQFDHRVAGRTPDPKEFFNAVAVAIDEVVRLSIESLLAQRRKS